jgi:hypothetical protein
VLSEKLRIVAFLVPALFSGKVFAQTIGKKFLSEQRLYVEASPQFNLISQPGVQKTQAYGAEYSVFYNAYSQWAIGGSLRQVFSIMTGGTSVLSGFAVHVKHYLTGGDIPKSTSWSYGDEEFLVTSTRFKAGLSIIGSLEQIYLNGGDSTIPFSGGGCALQYEVPLFKEVVVNAGVAVERLSSAKRVLYPVRGKLGFGLFLP